MKRISSSMTFYSKRIAPVGWVLVNAIFIGTAVALEGENARAARIVALCFLFVLNAIYFVYMRKRVWPLADVVWDCDDHLIVKKAGREERLELADLYSVRWFPFRGAWPLKRVTLVLRTPGAFGGEVSFWTESWLLPQGKLPIVDALNDRIDAGRRASAARRRGAALAESS